VMLMATVLVVAGGACASEKSPDSTASNPNAASPSPIPAIEVSAREYEFKLSETLLPGEATFNLRNTGKEKHELVIFKLKTNKPAEKILDLPQKEGRKLVEEVGGTFAKPGRIAANPIRAELTPGVYALVCFVPTANGTPHFAKGMVEEVTVE
jgi:hypothetical protein